MNYWDDLIDSMRPKHWVKNILVFTALVFAGKLDDPVAIAKTVAAFCAFCILSSSNYLLNDALDKKHDIHHPIKKNRSIAKGNISITHAAVWYVLLAIVGLSVLGILGRWPLYTGLAFIAIGTVYSIWLKKIVIVDIFAIAAGFLLRTVAGAVAIEVPVSSWLLICTLLLSLFLALTKRGLEIKLLEENAAAQRPSLAHYNGYLLDQMSAAITSAIVITYTLYTLSPATVDRFGGRGLFLTVPIVLYGMFRYLYLVHQKEVTATLESVLIHDRPMILAMTVYVVVVFGSVYI